MSGVNKAILVGNLGKDPEIRYLESGVPVCTFSLATSEVRKDQNGERITTVEWHNIVLWRGLAEVASKWLKKGSQIYVEGKIRTREYTDKEGVKRRTTEIVADEMTMLGGGREGSSQASNAGAPIQAGNPTQNFETVSPPTADSSIADDDLPF